MLRLSLILALLLHQTKILVGQTTINENYNCYSKLIESEIIETTQSVMIIARQHTDSSLMSWLLASIRSKEPQQIEEIRFLTRDDKGEPIQRLDTFTQNAILGFCQSQLQQGRLTNQFNVKVAVFLTDSILWGKRAQKTWDHFHSKYPNSGGIFEFSQVYYTTDGLTAVFYHSLSRNGLNAHGALTIMDKSTGQWKVKYHINYWQA